MGHFVVIEKELKSIEGKLKKNTFLNKLVLHHQRWNDYFKYRTLYNLYFVRKDEVILLGEVKIADTNPEGIHDPEKICLPSEFDNLDNSFFSVGQNKDYYININKNIDDLPINPLIALNDMSYNLDILSSKKSHHVAYMSLLRSVTKSTIRRQFNRLANGGAELTSYDFSYIFKVNKNDSSLGENVMEVAVKPESHPPTNIHVLIGSNGVGKSWLLNNMIQSYIDRDKNEKFGYFKQNDFLADSEEDIFPNLIYMSYSAFANTENIEMLNDREEKKYIYLGLRKVSKESDIRRDHLNKSIDDLASDFTDSLFECIASKNKKKLLIKSLEIFEFDPVFCQENLKELLDLDETDKNKKYVKNYFKSHLSSGHGIIMINITKLIQTVEEGSLVLIDEPETHLHPPLLAAFIKFLSELLVFRDAVAIIATHSPVVLQEIPKSCVWKLRRSGELTRIERLQRETFGESYGCLLEDVFGLEVQNSGFHKIIEKEVEELENYDELIKKYDNQLGKDADIIARTLFMLKEQSKYGND